MIPPIEAASPQRQQDLAEIRALVEELDESSRDVLSRIREARDELGTGSGGNGGERPSEPPIAFVHVPKTAGGTVTSMFNETLSRKEVLRCPNYLRSPERTAKILSRRRAAQTRVAVGRVPYGLYREHLRPDTRYMTFLREPVDRVVSYYYRHAHRPGVSPEMRKQRGKAASLEEAIEMRIPQLEQNLATRFLCGDPSPMEELPADALERAKSNLREFTFVGIQERFWESIVLLRRALGLDLVPVVDRHVSRDRPSVDEIPEDQRRTLAERNQLDAELYEFALELFDEAAGAVDRAELDAEVERLQELGTATNEEALEEARAWLDREVPVRDGKPPHSVRDAAKAAGINPAAVRRVWERPPR
jgi:hypothetical protein